MYTEKQILNLIDMPVVFSGVMVGTMVKNVSANAEDVRGEVSIPG